MLKRGADTNAQGGNYGNALQAAAHRGDQDIVKLLLKRGADINAQGGYYGNALQAAAHGGDRDTVKLLLERGADVNAQGGDYGNALQAAAYGGDQDIVKLLLKRGADINAQGGYYGNALQAAVFWGDRDTVKLLLERGADVNAQGGNYGNALQAAAHGGDQDIVKLLLERGADINAQGGYYGNALQAAAHGADQDTVKLLLERGADINAQGGYYGNALQAAARWGYREIVKLLLERGADVNAQGGDYGNALQAAARGGDQDTIKLLLERGADINAQGGEDGNALQAAASGGHLDTVKLLLERGADVTIQPRLVTRLSLLHVGIASNNLAVLKVLCDAGAGIHLSSQDDSGLTPLHVAVDKGYVAIAKYVLDIGASPDIEDLGDTNPFQLAIHNQNRDMVLLLYPKTTAGLSSINASDWRRCSGPAPNCNLEMINDESPKVVFRDESLKRELDEMSYPLSSRSTELPAKDTDFMSKHRNGKRIFILADGSMLHPEVTFNFHCRWWYKSIKPRHTDLFGIMDVVEDRRSWILRMKSAPSQNTIRQTLAKDCFLECALSFTCYALPENIEHWPNNVQLAGNSLREFESRQGILWIMMKSEAQKVYSHSRNPVLESRIFFSTSEYAEIPKMATDLLPPLLLKVRSIWDQNFSRFQERLGLMRTKILRSSGTDPNLIQYLLIDAQLLEILKENLTKQIETFRSFRDRYQSESARALHELPLDEVRNKMDDFEKASDELRTTTEKQLRNLTESSQNMIQLEFNLTSIAEAQKSTSTNKSMKRLSWITFIFLPLLFIASLFGMNVDILKSNPAWWWYLPFAILTTLVTFIVWIIFKWSKSLEGNLEARFQWLFQQPKGEQDLETGSKPRIKARRVKTTAFPASGKKRS